MGQYHRGRAILWLVWAVALGLLGWSLWGLSHQAETTSATTALSTTQDIKLVALTFDDGPRRATTTALLDGLSARGVQATFFLVGSRLEFQEDVVARMEEEGHQVGIHTFDHLNQLSTLNESDFRAQVDATRQALADILGHDDFIFRPPYGKFNDDVLSWASCPLVLWSVDPEDWDQTKSAQDIAQAICDQVQDGDIILMHDIFDNSVAAALDVVDRLLSQGYRFVTVETLFAARHIPLEAGTVYWNAYP